MPKPEPRLVVFTTLFPHAGAPGMGLFIRERMFRVAKSVPLTVVAPVPWFPMQTLIRRWKPFFRPAAPSQEIQDGIAVLHPRFLSVPGAFKWLDGFFMALACLPAMRRLQRSFGFNVIDAHFAYPDGYAATLLGRWLHVPVAITLRGTEVPLAKDPRRRRRIVGALQRADRVFSVSDSLKRHAVALGIEPERIAVVGNGVDLQKFRPVRKAVAREALGLPGDARVLITVGALVERKGFHRVLECLPLLLRRFPDLIYLVVGGPGPEGDWSAVLREHVARLGLQACVRFLGPIPPERLHVPLSAADVFVLATRNEGWANVLLEAMACGLPVVTTDVGGNAEVVSSPALGTIVGYGDGEGLSAAIGEALDKPWDRQAILDYAGANEWNRRVAVLVREFETLADLAGHDHRARGVPRYG